MNLKIAPNSIFAILLRSSWWISLCVVLAIAAASQALLPEQLRFFGWMSAVPFAIIGAITAWRQLRAPSAQQVDRILQHAAAMSWRDFAEALAQAYEKQGYGVSRLDGKMADLLLAKAGRSTLLVGRRWKAANHGVATLRALSDARIAQDASHGIYITIGEAGAQATRFAAGNGIQMLHGAALAQLLGNTVVAKKS